MAGEHRDERPQAEAEGPDQERDQLDRAKISGASANGASFGQNSKKKLQPCFQKPTPSTIAKLTIDSTPVTVNWLVTVKGCAPGTIPNGIAPMTLANRMKVKAVNTHGT